MFDAESEDAKGGRGRGNKIITNNIKMSTANIGVLRRIIELTKKIDYNGEDAKNTRLDNNTPDQKQTARNNIKYRRIN